MSRPKAATNARPSHRSTLSLQKTEVLINVYDLLSPGHVSNVLWTLGTSLLHSGVVINGKEYAYGGHDRRGVTGVYWTRPRTDPPGGTFRCEILHGFALATPAEIDDIVRSASSEFLGPSYNLLTKNCNHFTAYLCRKLTGRPGPAWLNRAASIGLALPCVVPREWFEPPENDTVEGALLQHDEAERRYSEDSLAHGRPSYEGGYEDDHASGSGYEDGFMDGSGGFSDGFDETNEHTSMLRPSHRLHLVGVSSESFSSSNTRSNSSLSSPHTPGSPGMQRQSSDASAGRDAEPRASTSTGGRRSNKGKSRATSKRWDAAGHALPPSERILP